MHLDPVLKFFPQSGSPFRHREPGSSTAWSYCGMCTHSFQYAIPEDLSSCDLHIIYTQSNRDPLKSSSKSKALFPLDGFVCWDLPLPSSGYQKYLNSKWYSWSSLSLLLLSELLHQSLHFRLWSCWHYFPLLLLSRFPSLSFSLDFVPSLSLLSSSVYWPQHITACMCILANMERKQDERKWPFHSLHFPLTPSPPITIINPQQAHSPAQLNSGSGWGSWNTQRNSFSCPVSSSDTHTHTHIHWHIHTRILKSRLGSI